MDHKDIDEPKIAKLAVCACLALGFLASSQCSVPKPPTGLDTGSVGWNK